MYRNRVNKLECLQVSNSTRNHMKSGETMLQTLWALPYFIMQQELYAFSSALDQAKQHSAE